MTVQSTVNVRVGATIVGTHGELIIAQQNVRRDTARCPARRPARYGEVSGEARRKSMFFHHLPSTKGANGAPMKATEILFRRDEGSVDWNVAVFVDHGHRLAASDVVQSSLVGLSLSVRPSVSHRQFSGDGGDVVVRVQTQLLV